MLKHAAAILIINILFSALSYSQVSGGDTTTNSVQEKFREITVSEKERLDLLLAGFQTMRSKHERIIQQYLDSTNLAKAPDTTGTGLIVTADGATYSLQFTIRVPYETSQIIYNFNRSGESIKLIHAVSTDNVSQVVWRSKIFQPQMSGAMVIYKGKTIYGFTEFDESNHFAGLNFSTDAHGKIVKAKVRKQPSSMLVKSIDSHGDYSTIPVTGNLYP